VFSGANQSLGSLAVYGNSLGEGKESCKRQLFSFQTVKMTRIINSTREISVVLSLVESSRVQNVSQSIQILVILTINFYTIFRSLS